MVDYSNLSEKVMAILEPEMQSDDDYSSAILTGKITSAIEEVKFLRHYENSSYTDEKISADLENYFSVVLNLARYDYNQRGAEGQQTHNENSINRTWVDRNTITRAVKPFVKVF